MLSHLYIPTIPASQHWLSSTTFTLSDLRHRSITKGSHPEKKAAYLWTFYKKGVGGGSTRIQKFWGIFIGAFFWTFSNTGGGVNLFQKFWGSFEVV